MKFTLCLSNFVLRPSVFMLQYYAAHSNEHTGREVKKSVLKYNDQGFYHHLYQYVMSLSKTISALINEYQVGAPCERGVCSGLLALLSTRDLR